MRTFRDRVRHAVSYEIIGLFLFIPVGVLLFNQPITEMSIVAIASSLVSTIWNFVYNVSFDKIMFYFRGTTEKNVIIRVFHAILFEVGLTISLVPVVAWYLGISLIAAFVMDITIVVFYLGYTFCFNLAYDYNFPIDEKKGEVHYSLNP
ncbi:PACE efflux transporter [Commensalibacter nepenthis]|uniref:PACE efflux transporter n=1 Tax=Commensalibacter nepenthis TaxID=3043872 RepID=A0ABT6Q5N5_9PROT|nr:PACE efflux transporter [Commensalibacter sp. TBRC 10068]MDI2112197.1 PACE efflux transporter [Commensalibacter sp. TBRC 10068]